MAVLWLNNIDLNKNQLQNALLHPLGSDPSSPSAGQVWYRTDLTTLAFRTGSTTIRLGSLDQITAPAADVSLNSHKITNLTDPGSAQDAATKAYVDSLVGAGISWKAPARAATTANGTLATAFANGQTIDGVTLATGDRILLKDQTAPAENGLYVVAASGAPTRATDADTSGELSGAAMFVKEGTNNADSAWVLTTDGTITVNTTGLTFVQFSGLGQITAGAGLTKTGNTIDVIGTAARILVNANSIDIDSAYVGQASITTLGTITTGTWNGTGITVAFGGTGRATLTNHGVLVGAGTGAITQLAVGSTGQVLRGSTGADPAFGALDLTTDVGATILPIANGGTSGATASAARIALGAATVITGTLGNGSLTTIPITHGLAASKAVIARVYDNTTPFSEVEVEIQHTSTTVISFIFAVAPTSAQYQYVIIGLS